MDRWIGKIAVVTGASAGIGLATVNALVNKGMIVVGLARRKSILEEMSKKLENQKGKFYNYKCDVSNEQNVIEAFQWIRNNVGKIQVLVNNAGIINQGSILATKSENWKNTFNVNVMGLLYCSRQAMEMMVEDKIEGHIININSIEGHRVYPIPGLGINVYPASKHAVTAITETLQSELHGKKIKVTSISPGLVRTDIFEANNYPLDFTKLPVLEKEDVADSVVNSYNNRSSTDRIGKWSNTITKLLLQVTTMINAVCHHQI